MNEITIIRIWVILWLAYVTSGGFVVMYLTSKLDTFPKYHPSNWLFAVMIFFAPVLAFLSLFVFFIVEPIERMDRKIEEIRFKRLCGFPMR